MSRPLISSSIADHLQSALNKKDNLSYSDTFKLIVQLVEQTSDVLIAADVDYKPLTWNKASEKIFGLDAGQVIGKDIRKILSIHRNSSSQEKISETVEREGEWRGEISFTRPSDNNYVTLWMNIKELKEDREKIIGYLITASDITERKNVERKLGESERRFRDIADTSPAMMWLSDENEITVYANKKWIEFTGKEIGADPEGWSSLIHPEDRTKTTAAYFTAVGRNNKSKLYTVCLGLTESTGGCTM